MNLRQTPTQILLSVAVILFGMNGVGQPQPTADGVGGRPWPGPGACLFSGTGGNGRAHRSKKRNVKL